ncbi:hypothetical protein J1N35_024587 [Gossypium stocksii]|uniref:Uncharacterized protein n=1 Tax=Gossypium stocksii TaxID=47602 RepID=A0A9D3ZX02_9ROSI|nr:hypothetical protein J1N35_024587 [Gossypium stocksii]
MCIDELIESVQTFKINLDESRKNKIKEEKSLALQVTEAVPADHNIVIEVLQEQITLLTQNFNKAFKYKSK